MSRRPYGVHVVVDPSYGARLHHLPAGEPVWVVDSEANHAVIGALWQEHGNRDNEDDTIGITSFRFNPEETPEDWLIAEVAAIDLHHGHYSHDPSYSWINVIGTPWSKRIQVALDEFGLFEHEVTTEGFIARRTIRE